VDRFDFLLGQGLTKVTNLMYLCIWCMYVRWIEIGRFKNLDMVF